MKDTLKVGDTHAFRFRVTDAKTVPALYPESPDFRSMPAVFATGFMVGLMEWACIDALKPHLDEGEGSLGVHIDVTHLAATPPGMEVSVHVTCTRIDGRRIAWHVRAEDEMELIGEGSHQRAIVRWDRFGQKVAEKAARSRSQARGRNPQA
ncbi:thioesterase family protein [Dongia sp.]|uniref:thioesterase family protein n=1 Tax=Dongia sp. TaxID=1977262 RepID=UPI0035B34BE5